MAKGIHVVFKVVYIFVKDKFVLFSQVSPEYVHLLSIYVPFIANVQLFAQIVIVNILLIPHVKIKIKIKNISCTSHMHKLTT